jgi:hypothetical protein
VDFWRDAAVLTRLDVEVLTTPTKRYQHAILLQAAYFLRIRRVELARSGNTAQHIAHQREVAQTKRRAVPDPKPFLDPRGGLTQGRTTCINLGLLLERLRREWLAVRVREVGGWDQAKRQTMATISTVYILDDKTASARCTVPRLGSFARATLSAWHSASSSLPVRRPLLRRVHNSPPPSTPTGRHPNARIPPHSARRRVLARNRAP